MTATVVKFPARGPFCVRIGRIEGCCWLVVARSHSWLHANFSDALADARTIALGFGVSIKVVLT